MAVAAIKYITFFPSLLQERKFVRICRKGNFSVWKASLVYGVPTKHINHRMEQLSNTMLSIVMNWYLFMIIKIILKEGGEATLPSFHLRTMHYIEDMLDASDAVRYASCQCMWFCQKRVVNFILTCLTDLYVLASRKFLSQIIKIHEFAGH